MGFRDGSRISSAATSVSPMHPVTHQKQVFPWRACLSASAIGSDTVQGGAEPARADRRPSLSRQPCPSLTFVGAASSVVHAAVGALLGENLPAPSFAPAGEDPIVYAILYPIFGVALLVARITAGSLWASIAMRLTCLTVVRVVVDGAASQAGRRPRCSWSPGVAEFTRSSDNGDFCP